MIVTGVALVGYVSINSNPTGINEKSKTTFFGIAMIILA